MELKNRDFVGDFLGFSYNDTHSSTLGLVRVSAGNRYSKNLFPAFANKTVQPEGKDGFYYFGAYYTNNQFQVETAFDNLSEAQFQKLSTAFSCKQFKELWFDETPYKAFWAKLAEAPQIKYMCFTGDNGQRVYKGDVTFKFETLEPWAHNRVCNWDESVFIIKRVQNDNTYENTVAPQIYWVEDGNKFVYEEGRLYESFNFDNWNNNGDINIDFTEKRIYLSYFFSVDQETNKYIKRVDDTQSQREDDISSKFVGNENCYLVSGLTNIYVNPELDPEVFYLPSYQKTIYKNKININTTNQSPPGYAFLLDDISDDIYEFKKIGKKNTISTAAELIVFLEESNLYTYNFGVKEADYLLKYGISQVYTENDNEYTYHDMQYKFKVTYGNNVSQEFIIEIKDKLFDNQHTSYDLYIDSRKQICYVIKNGRKYILNMERIEGDIFKIPQGEYEISVDQKKSTDQNWSGNDDTNFSYSNNISGIGNKIKPYYYFY